MRFARASSERIPWAAQSNVGLVRKQNEDYFLARPDIGLWILCDGLGGHQEGESASWVCAMTVADHVAAGVDLVGAVYQAHYKVWRLTYAKANQFDQCGTTVAALRVRDGRWEIAWVGDTRIWLYESKGFRQISRDHTVARQLLDWGEINPEEEQSHPDRNRLTQVVGISENPLDVGYKSGKWGGGHIFLLATDGLAYWNDPEKLAEILVRAPEPEVAVDRLTQASMAYGGKDNVSLIVVGQYRPRSFFSGNVFRRLPSRPKKL